MADHVVIGAGVIGTSIAFHLAQRRAGNITVVEKGTAGEGGTGRSSALVRMHYTYPPEVRLAVKSLEYFQNWREMVGVNSEGDFRRTGFVRIVRPGDVGRLEQNVAMQRANGAKVEVVTGDQLREIEPGWFVEDVAKAAYEPDSGYGDGAGATNDFLARAREMGVEYLSNRRATGIKVSGDHVTGVQTDKGDIDAPRVVVAMGPWTRSLLQGVAVDLPIEPELHRVAVLKDSPAMRSGGSACIDSITMAYHRPEGADMTLIGDRIGKRGVDPDHFPQSVPDEALAEITMKAAHRIRTLEEAGFFRGITGVYDISPDSRPLLGEVHGIGGLYLAAGFSGTGFKISPAVGLVMAELLVDGEATTVDIRPFRPSRFDDGEPIRGEFDYEQK